jgi:LacI family transcriptional regulator
VPYPITLADIAAHVGCNKSTVSRALRNQPGVLGPTAERIRSVALKLGYRPDPIQAQAATQRWRHTATSHLTYTAAFIIPCYGSRAEVRMRAQPFADAAHAYIQTLGCGLDTVNASDYRCGAELSRVLRARGVRGIVVPQIPAGQLHFFQEMDWTEFTGVGCQSGWAALPLHVVDSDESFASSRAWRRLATLGYRRIAAALTAHRPWAEDDFSRHGAISAEQAAAEPPLVRLSVFSGLSSDRQAFVEWLLQVRPDAVIGFHEGMLGWIREAGFRVPEEIGFATLRGAGGPERCSGFVVDRTLIAVAAVDLLMTQIRNNQWGFPANRQRVLIEPTWVDGETLRRSALQRD